VYEQGEQCITIAIDLKSGGERRNAVRAIKALPPWVGWYEDDGNK
jgi:hypothetical protein